MGCLRQTAGVSLGGEAEERDGRRGRAGAGGVGEDGSRSPPGPCSPSPHPGPSTGPVSTARRGGPCRRATEGTPAPDPRSHHPTTRPRTHTSLILQPAREKWRRWPTSPGLTSTGTSPNSRSSRGSPVGSVGAACQLRRQAAASLFGQRGAKGAQVGVSAGQPRARRVVGGMTSPLLATAARSVRQHPIPWPTSCRRGPASLRAALARPPGRRVLLTPGYRS